MGRTRKHNSKIPKHINQKQLPDNCHWDNSGTGRWYTKFIAEDGERRQKTIADSKATVANLHRVIEDFHSSTDCSDTFSWIAEKYFKSQEHLVLTRKSRKSYRDYFDKLFEVPTSTRKPLPDIPLKHWNTFLVQRIVDYIAENRGPTIACRTHGFIQLTFNWGLPRNYCTSNPAQGVKRPTLKPKQKLPSMEAYIRLLQFAQEKGTWKRGKTGCCAHYWWIVMELSYLCRMRGIEVRHMNDSDIRDEGVYIRRAKGSRDNIVAWNDRLRHVVTAAQAVREEIWDHYGLSIPIRADRRLLVVNNAGAPIKAPQWAVFIDAATDAGVITKEERFTPHDLKRLGVTNTSGNRHDKQEASGHKSANMMDIYDKSVAVVQAAGDENSQ